MKKRNWKRWTCATLAVVLGMSGAPFAGLTAKAAEETLQIAEAVLSGGDVSEGDVSAVDVLVVDTTTGDASTVDDLTVDTSTVDALAGDASTGDASTGDALDGNVSTGDVSDGDVSTGDVSTGDTSTGKQVAYGSDIVDGVAGADYAQAQKITAANVLVEGEQTVTTTDGTADITFMWDEAFLYMAAEVEDADVYTASGKGEQEDSISLTIAKDLTAGKDVKNYCFTAGGDAYVVGFDTSGFSAVKTYTAADGVYADAQVTNDGYRIEACMEWDALGIDPTGAQQIALEAIVNSCSTQTSGRDFMRATGLTAYPQNMESYLFWGFLQVQYNAGLYAENLTAFTLAEKTVDTVAENIGRYSLIKYADTFYDNYVKPYPIQTSYDAQKVSDARAYALTAEATKEGIAEHRQILETMAGVLTAENYGGKLMTLQGTPVVDGKDDDALWANAYAYKTNVAADGQYAEVRTLWDDDAMYALVKVFDPTFDVAGADAHTKDSVEFFFLAPEDAEANSFGKYGGQWRINRANQVTVTFGMNEPFYAKVTEMEDGSGYIVEARLEFADAWTISNETVMNFDIAVNLCANGNRTEAVAWTSGDCYSNPKTAGEMVYLDTSAGTSVVSEGYNPYALIKVLDKALVMDVADYDAADFAAHYDKALLQQYYDAAMAGGLTAAQIAEYYDDVIDMMSKITYDGVHRSALGFEADHNLPDPFTMADGTKVQTEADWAERHEEIQDLYEFYMYGKLPVAEETGLTKSFTVSAEDASTFVIGLNRNGVEKSFSFKVYMPEGTAPEGGWPYIINYGANIEGAQEAGYAVIDYNSNNDVASSSSLYTGVFYDLYPECRGDNYKTGVGHLAARAWGAGLIIDCIEEGIGDLSKLDPVKSAVSGFSYLGKTALVTGVLEERIAVTNPAHSGIGGAALLRYTSQGKKYYKSEYPMEMEEDFFLTPKTEPIGQAQGQGALWVKSIFADFIGSDSTPFDTHMLLALVAPRGLFVSSGYFDNGTDPEGMYGAYLGAQKVYQFLNKEGNIVYADFPTSHATSTAETQAFFQYLDYYFYGTELPEGFRDTVYDNSPDRAEYDVIRVPEKQNPSEDAPASGSSSSSSSSGSSAKEEVVDWNKVQAEVKQNATGAANGVNLSYNSTGETKVPASMLQELKGDNVTVAFQSGNGVALSISGKKLQGVDVNKLQQVDLTVTHEPNVIPAAAVASKAAVAKRQLSIRDTGSFGVAVDMHINMGKENAGKIANLYRYNHNSGRLEFCSHFVITGEGQSMFAIARGGDYMITVTNTVVKETVWYFGGDYTVQSGDSLSAIAVRYHMPLSELVRRNPQLANPNLIKVGQKLNVQ